MDNQNINHKKIGMQMREQLLNNLYVEGLQQYEPKVVRRPKNSRSLGPALGARLYSLTNNLIKPTIQKQTPVLLDTPKQAFMPQTMFEKNQRLQQDYLATVYQQTNQEQLSQTTTSSQFTKSVKFTKLKPLCFTQQKKEEEGLGEQMDQTKKQHNETIEQIGRMINKIKNDDISEKNVIKDQNKKNIQNKELAPKVERQISAGTLEAQETSETKNEKMDLNIYIGLIQKGNPNIDKFVYLIKNKQNDDPYDLILKQYVDIQKQNNQDQGKLQKKDFRITTTATVQDYYTISVNGIINYKNGKPIEYIKLHDWLKERETYQKIKQLPFFANFRKWKTLKMWTNNYRSFKQRVAKKGLQQKLLINTPEIQESLMAVRETLYNMQTLRFMEFNSMKDAQRETPDLITLIRHIKSKAQQTQNMIVNYSKEIHETVQTAVEGRLEKLRNIISQNSEGDNVRKVNRNVQAHHVFGGQKNPYEALSFPENMPYDKRSDLRKECFRFVRFFYLIDFQAQSAIQIIYNNSLKFFLEEIEDLSSNSDPLIITDLDKARQNAFKEPLLKLNVTFDLHYEKLKGSIKIENVPLPEFKYPQQQEEEKKVEDYKNYNILAYPFLVDYDVEDDFNDQQKKYLEYCDQREIYQKRLTNIEKVTLALSPDLEQIQKSVNQLLIVGLNSLQAFESFIQHREMLKYQAVLEELETVDDSHNQNSTGGLLDPSSSINGEFKQQMVEKIQNVFKDQFTKAQKYLSEFKQFLQADWEYSQVDFDFLMNRNLAKPGLTFNAIFNLIEYQKQHFELNTPFQADIGIFRILSRKFKMEIIEKPKRFKERLSERIPVELYERITKVNNWFQESITKLKLNTGDIEAFVQLTKNLQTIEKKYAYHKELFRTTKEIIDAAKKFQVEIKKEHIIMFNDFKNLDQYLSSQIIQVNDNLNKNQEVFSSEIRTQTIPRLLKECRIIEDKIYDPSLMDFDNQEALPKLLELQQQLNVHIEQAEKINIYEEVLQVQQMKFTELGKLKDQLDCRVLLWESHGEWFQETKKIRQQPFAQFDIESVQELINNYNRHLQRIKAQLQIDNKILQQLETDINMFTKLIPIINALKNEKLTKNNFLEIEQLVQQQIDLGSITIDGILQSNILDNQSGITAISIQVTQEAILKQKLLDIEARYAEIQFPLVPFKSESLKETTYLLGDSDDIVKEVDQLIIMINAVYGSRYLKELRKMAADKRKDILLLQELLSEWIKFQRYYQYLESIFSQPELKKPLQIEVKEFEDQINKVYKQNIKKIFNVKTAIALSKQKLVEGYVASFKKHNDLLQELTRKLNKFLDSKRELFPRFYFISNEELLFILANNDVPSQTQIFLRKLFENVFSADFGNDPRSTSIQQIQSKDGEILQLKTPVNIKNESVEKWLKKLEDVINDSLYKSIKESLTLYTELPRQEWYTQSLAQPLLIISMLAWTYNIEECIKNIEKDDDEGTDLNDIMNELLKNIEQLSELLGQEELPQQQRTSLMSVLITEIHNRDQLRNIIKQNIQSRNEFIWQNQLKYYQEEGGELKTSLYTNYLGNKLKYGFEYYGPVERIIITPLTERCQLTISSALQIFSGTQLVGPAGTGKTETVRDFARQIGRLCIIFNCSDQTDAFMVEKLMRGIIRQGAWICFDEFNRMNMDTLSSVAQIFQEMKTALASIQNEEDFLFCAQRCKLNDNCGFFITMNASYKGRSDLPENLKALFRPVNMMVPDYSMIAQIKLCASGFKQSEQLSFQIVNLFNLANQQLSQQYIYDFGMRAVKCCLDIATVLKKKGPGLDEQNIVIQAIKQTTQARLLKGDIKIFNGLIGDVFQGGIQNAITDTLLSTVIEEQLNEQKLQPTTPFIDKIMEINSIVDVRYGTIILGDTMSGKTTMIQTLFHSLNAIRGGNGSQPIRLSNVYPKTLSIGELYGHESSSNGDWVDGVASLQIKKAADGSPSQIHWTLFDGQIDTEWIENINSVLDDQRFLCLSNGERIRVSNNLRLLFEVSDLLKATPSTISRCGIVYVHKNTLNWNQPYQIWLKKIANDKEMGLSQSIIQIIDSLFVNNIENYLEQFAQLHKPQPVSEKQILPDVFTYMQITLLQLLKSKVEGGDEIQLRISMAAFIMSCTWAFCGCLQEKEAERMNASIIKKFPSLTFPNEPLINCYIDLEDIDFKSYQDLVQKMTYTTQTDFWNIVVPTVDTIRVQEMITASVKNGKNILVTGSIGSGKSLLINDMLHQFQKSDNYDCFKYYFTPRTTPNLVSEYLTGSLFLLSQKARGAKFGKRNLIMIDDVNLPLPDKYQAQGSLELIRQLLNVGFIYTYKDSQQVDILDTQLICLSSTNESGRQALSSRFNKNFTNICLQRPRMQTLQRIFSQIIESYFLDAEDSVQLMMKNVVSGSIAIFEKISNEKLPTPEKYYYVFNPRDIARSLFGIIKCSASGIKDGKHLSKLWAHETYRVFGDRLSTPDDRQWFTEEIKQTADSILGLKGEKINYESLIFTSITSYDEDQEVNSYIEVEDKLSLKQIIIEKLDDYNKTRKEKMKLVIFEEVIDNILKLTRILDEPFGNIVIIGNSGLGKRSLLKLSSLITQNEFHECMARTVEQFREQIKKNIILKILSNPQKHFTFSVSERFAQNEIVYDGICSLISQGKINGLFTKEEKDKIEKSIIEENSTNVLNTLQTPFDILASRVQNNLHIALSFLPQSLHTKTVFRHYPILIEKTQIIYMSIWPQQAVISVNQSVLEEQDINNPKLIAHLLHKAFNEIATLSQQQRSSSIVEIPQIPKLSIDCAKLLIYIMNQQESIMKQKRDILQKGSIKIDEMFNIVQELQKELKSIQPQLEEKRLQTEEKLKQLEQITHEANRQRERVENETNAIQVKKEQIELINNQTAAQLSEAMPRVLKAENEVRNIDKRDLNTIKHLPNVGATIEFVFQTVCVALDEKYISWKNTGIKMLQDLNKFIETLIVKIDKIKIHGSKAISEQTLQHLQKNLKNDAFQDQKIESNSIVRPLAYWCRAIYEFANLKRQIEPLETNVQELKIKLEESQRDFDKMVNELEKCKLRVTDLQSDFNLLDQNRIQLEEMISITKTKLKRAEKLTILLSSESFRWKEDFLLYENKLQRLLGDSFISSFFISYQGVMNQKYKKEIISICTSCLNGSVEFSQDYNFNSFLGDVSKINQWNLQGLPSDDASVSNALSACNGNKWPLFIDPYGQALHWIRNTFQHNITIISKDTDIKIAHSKITQAIQSGLILVIQDAFENLDGSIRSLLQQQFITLPENSNRHIIFNDEQLEAHYNFNIFIIQRELNQSLAKEAITFTNIINFSVSNDVLEDQLLTEVMKLENPDIETQKNENIEKISKNKLKLLETEKKILTLLVDLKTSPVEDDTLLVNLESAKATAKEIKDKLEQIGLISRQVNHIREKYREVAQRGAVLFDVVNRLSFLNPMYQYSLQYFIKLFKNAILSTIDNQNQEERVQQLTKAITQIIFMNIKQGLLKKHQLIFKFLISAKIELAQQTISSKKLELFLYGHIDEQKYKSVQNPDPKLFSEEGWDIFTFLATLEEKWKLILTHYIENNVFWKKIILIDNIFDFEYPSEIVKDLTNFDILLLAKIFKQDKLVVNVSVYIQKIFEQEKIQDVNNCFELFYEDTDSTTPTVFMITKGTDVSSKIFQLGRQKGFVPYQKLIPVIIGQGQLARALGIIKIAQQDGNWILIENCHLISQDLGELEKITQDIQEGIQEVHQDFRLLLTTTPCEYFSSYLIQNCIKVAIEQSKSFKESLQNSLMSIPEDQFENNEYKNAIGRLTFGLCLFHSSIAERVKYGHMGWNQPYEFNEADLSSSLTFLKKTLLDVQKKEDIPWQAIDHIIGSIAYGGRITDKKDNKLMQLIMKKFINEQVLDERFRLNGMEQLRIPKQVDKQAYVDAVSVLDKQSDLELLGLHRNVLNAHILEETKGLFDCILKVLPMEAITEIQQTDKSSKLIEIVSNIINSEKGIPPIIQLEASYKEAHKNDKNQQIDPIINFLYQEIQRYNTLITNVQASLQKILMSIQGKHIMTKEIEEMSQDVLNNKIPQQWRKVCYLTEKTLSEFVSDLRERIKFINNWINEVKLKQYWAPGLFYPQGLFMSILQIHARKRKQVIQKYVFSFKVIEQEQHSNNIDLFENSLIISGIHIEGGFWDKKRKMILDLTSTSTVSNMPLIAFIPKEQNDIKGHFHPCPFYQTQSRKGYYSSTGQSINYIMDVTLPCDRNTDYWTLRNICLFIQKSIL